MKLHTISFGCQMAFADSDEMARTLGGHGFAATRELAEADAVLVNTCTVREHAEHRAVSQIGRLKHWKAARPDRFLIVAGCAAERLKEELRRRFPHVDLVVGAKSIDEFPELLDRALRERYDQPGQDAQDFSGVSPSSGLRPPSPNGRRNSAVRSPIGKGIASIPSPFGRGQGEGDMNVSVASYVTIMRGCNYSCAYCIVPAVRGREIYRDPGSILAEVRARVAEGAKEILLLGQTVNSYRYDGVALTLPSPAGPTLRDPGVEGVRPKGRGGRFDFAALLRLVDGVAGLERIRFMSPHPHYLDAGMIAAMAECPKVCEHLHLPAQSGSDRVLKAMRRNYTRRQYADRVAALRRAVPGVSVSTDIIVGFPGETEADFRETLSFIEQTGFDAGFCFKFSPREGTEAAGMTDTVPEAVKGERLQRALELVRTQAARSASAMVGTEAEVLVEGPGFGRTRTNRTVRVPEGARPGDLVRVRIEALRGKTLFGAIMEAATA